MATRGMSVFAHNGTDYTINDPNITGEFSASEAYAVGDYVNYQGDLWRFTSAHSAGAWNGNHAVKIKIGEEIGAVKTNVSKNAEKIAETFCGDYEDATTVTTGGDFNDLTTPGNYVVYSSSTAMGIDNMPEAAGGRLYVLTSIGSTTLIQMYITSNGVMYIRRLTPNTPSSTTPWKKVLTDEMFQLQTTLTQSDDLNSVQKPGVYWYSGTNKPAHAVDAAYNTRVLVIKSETASNKGASWQMLVNPDGVYYRVYKDSTSDFSDWEKLFTQSQFDEIEPTIIKYIKTLATTDDFNDLGKAGHYYQAQGAQPLNAPVNTYCRPLIIKSGTASNHNGETQLIVGDGILYYRGKKTSAQPWGDWKSVGLGAPIYQEEVLPYNATTYHAKWDELLQDRVLRRVSLGNVDSDSSLPIYAYEFSPNRDYVGLTEGGQASQIVEFNWSNALYQRPKILIIGGVHGNEKCTPMDIYKIAKLLKTRDYNNIACKFDWYFIPLVNPWGYSHARLDSNGNIIYGNGGVTAQIVACTEAINAGIRDNSHGQNINRDWSDVTYTYSGTTYGFQTPELQMIKNYVLGIAPDVFIDAHQNHTNQTETDTMKNVLCCYAGAPIDENGTDEYKALMKKIFRYIDIANADVNTIMSRYKATMEYVYQSCRVHPTIEAPTSEHYFGGVPVTIGGTTAGNTTHSSIATPYAICSETSEICANFSGTSEWYNQVACTFSTTYLWHIIKQMAALF